MDSDLKQDIRKLLIDIEKFQQTLVKLKQDQRAWARNRETKDLIIIINCDKRLESYLVR